MDRDSEGDRLDRVLALVRSHVPELRIVEKRNSRLMKGLGVLLIPITPNFKSNYTTILNKTVYLPRPMTSFDQNQLAKILTHKLVHQLNIIKHET